jgi:uncharacterized protein (DUF2267 family)
MILDFNKYAGEGTRFLRNLATMMRAPEDPDRAARVLKATLRAFRKQLTVRESLRLMEHLPMFLKAVYVDEWNIKEQEVRSRQRELLACARQQLFDTGLHDVVRKDDIALLLRAVLSTLRNDLSEGEWNDMHAQLPEEARKLLTHPLNVY